MGLSFSILCRGQSDGGAGGAEASVSAFHRRENFLCAATRPAPTTRGEKLGAFVVVEEACSLEKPGLRRPGE